MKTVLLIFACLTGWATSQASADSDRPTTKLFAAFAMTKAQQASSLPTDSGIFLRGKDDEAWSRIGPVIQSMNSVTADPSDPRTLFIACGNGIVRSEDGGASWRMVTGWRESDFTKIAIDPENGDNVYAASVWGLSVSRDGGDTWSPANKGLSETYCRSVVIDHRDPKRVLLGTGGGLYESRNRGKSWAPIKSSPQSNILRLSRSAVDPELWIAGTEGEGVFLSNSDGKRWNRVAPELDGRNLYAVALHAAESSRMAVGGWESGVWISEDGGKSWVDRGAGLPSLNVMAMAFDPNWPNRLWASTFEEGTYYSDDLGEAWIEGGLYGAYVFDLDSIPVEE